MMNCDNTACFSGYRPEKLPWGADENDTRCLVLKEKLTETAVRLYELGMRHFICGMARGCDTYFCETVLELRKEHQGVTLEAAIPCDGQSCGWSEDDRARYVYLLQECNYRTYVSREYSKGCMAKRNRFMVKNSSILLTVFDGKPGGTMYTRNYAIRRGLEVIEIAP